MKEIWKAIPGYEGHYEVSSLGRVRSLTREAKRAWGIVTIKGKMLKLAKLPAGYLFVGLCKDGEKDQRYIHDLVLSTFVCPRPDGMQCCHFPDDDKSNNNIDNLRWGTAGDNENDKIRLRTKKRGEQISNSKFTNKQAEQIRKMYATGKWSQQKLADKYGVVQFTISQLVRGKRYASQP